MKRKERKKYIPVCSFVESQPFCPENMFQCNNRACVEPGRICDFTDDCGDGSDEMDCGEGFETYCDLTANMFRVTMIKQV